MYVDRILPHDLEAEEAVIGSLVIDGEALSTVVSFLNPQDFYRERNRWCYEACLDLYRRNDPIDQATLGHELSRAKRLEEIGGHGYLSQLAAAVPTSLNIEHYARIVQHAAVLRQLISAGEEISTLGYENEAELEKTLDRAEDVLFRIRSRHSTRDFVHIREVIDKYLAEGDASALEQIAQGMGAIPSGFNDLDQLLGGLQRSDLVIVAGRPSLGKSSLAITIARYAARSGTVAAIFSLEMSSEQIGLRLMAAEAGVDSHRLRLGLLTDDEQDRAIDASGVLSELPIYIDDSPLLTAVELRGKARRLKMERGLDLIVVDYIQLIQGAEGRGQNRVQELGEITRSLKGLARDLNTPVLAVSQLSRAPEQRTSHRPQLSDLRESGSIEQDADVVMFIYRDDMYITREEWEQRYSDRPYPENIAELIIAKHRNGPIGSVHLRFQDRLAQFASLGAGDR
ncbi:replicative DNA helicase [SAR202 cluster bacterium AD-802-E10_MRT_200m]|nr:replicative DNA helicase [SAR202 cluster bacterium AD-802-E10_MRT_200m]